LRSLKVTLHIPRAVRRHDKVPLILLLENDENDVFWFRRALTACEVDADLRIVHNVMQARDYLLGRGAFSDRIYYRTPDLIVTDFKMHGQTGVEFIRWLRQESDYKEIPVVMYSGTALPQDKSAALESGALAFFQKSGDFKTVCDNISGIMQFMKPNPD
jgi:CheY-like chemotaxis protein